MLMMAMTPEQDAAGEVREDLAEEALDAMLAAEKQRQAAMFERFARAGGVTEF